MELNPDLFIEKIEIDFKTYIDILKNKDNKKERENFEEHYKERYETK